MENKLKDVLLSTFEPIDDEDNRLDERFYEFIDKEVLEEFFNEKENIKI